MRIVSLPCLRFVLALTLGLGGIKLFGQPSGGPYGPIQLEYAIPADTTTVYFVAPDGSANATGATLEAPTSIEAAFARARTGDAIILRGGIYRTGDLQFNQGITVQPFEDEKPILKGTRIATEWEALPGELWRTEWKTLFPLAPQPWWRKERHLRDTPVHLFNNDMVFVDGELLATKGYPAELDANSFCVDYESGYVYIGTDPTDRVVEITACDNALTRVTGEVHGKVSDKIGPKIRGIVFTQYAYRAIEIEGYNPEAVSPESAHGKDVVGTVLEHCTLSYCSRVGAYLRGDDMIIRHNLVTDTGTEGLFILSSNDVLLEKNIVTRNNEEGIQGYFATAIKIFNQCYRVTCNDNLILVNRDSSGIWYDVGNVDGVFTNNWIENTFNGFFFEISKGAICAGNVFVNCITGTRVLNSSGVKVYQNTYVNSSASFDRTTRSAVGDHFDWHPASGPDVDERFGHEFGNNLLVAHPSFQPPLLNVWQEPALCGTLTEPMLDGSDHNVYVRTGGGGLRPDLSDFAQVINFYRRFGYTDGQNLITWTPLAGEECNGKFDTLESFRDKVSGFEAGSIAFENYDGVLFHGSHLGNYALMPAFAAKVAVAPAPAFVEAVLPPAFAEADFPGAFPVLGDWEARP